MKDKPSATASLILKVVLFGSDHPDALHWSKLIAQQAIIFPKLFLWSSTNFVTRASAKLIESFLNPGFILHVNTRKEILQKISEEKLKEGLEQVLILGAGHDTLALRLAKKYPQCRFIEIDHRQTQKIKTQALSSAVLPHNLHFFPLDLSLHSLESCPLLQREKKTLVLIEGVLMYLAEDAVKNLLTELLRLFPKKLCCLFTFMHKQDDGSIQFPTAHPLVNWWLKQKKERFLWGAHPSELQGLCRQLGMEHFQLYDDPRLLSEKIAFTSNI